MNSARTFEEMMVHIDGARSAEYRRNAQMRRRLTQQGKRYRRLLPDKWPTLIFNWDLKRESQIFSLDGTTQEVFDEQYPNGLSIGHVSVAELDKVLCNFNRRNDHQELWNCGSESSLCYVLAYLAEGLPMSPPLVAVTTDNRLCLLGGNHRYTAAKFSGRECIPIYADPDNRLSIQSLVPVVWADT